MRLSSLLSVSALICGMVQPLQADNFYGDILAGRSALNAYDFATAERYFALAYSLDPTNLRVADALLTTQGANGDFAAALPIAKTLADQGENNPVAGVTLLVDAANRGDWEGIKAVVTAQQSPVPEVDKVFLGWAEIGLGNKDAGLAEFDTLARQDGSEVMATYHKALALAFLGDFAGADAVLTSPDGLKVIDTRRGLLIKAEVLSQLGRGSEAADLLGQLLGEGDQPPVDALITQLKTGMTLPFSIITSPKDGIAETFHTLQSAMNERTPAPYVITMGRAALALRPDHTDAKLVVAQLLETINREADAVAIYDSVPKGDLAYHAAQLGKSSALVKLDRQDEAQTTLMGLAKDYPDLVETYVNLGDIYRISERYVECVGAYDTALELFAKTGTDYWPAYFYRGMCHERLKDWDKAEPDFRKALELQPNQPQVLNYLGYSYVEQNANLDEALMLIKRAVAAAPDSGYIIDSLAWAYYRLGRYAEAVLPMEQAVYLTATDPVMNDHLGDIYWAVGRKREAQFQWERALVFNPDAADLLRIKRKLEVGLDQVLQEEGGRAIRPADDAGGDL